MNILQVNAIDNFGGAARIAWNLFQSYRNRGHRSWLVVDHKRSNDPDVYLIPNNAFRGNWSRFWIRVGERMTPFAGKIKGAGLIRRFATWHIGQHGRWLRIRTGQEDYDFPGTWQLLKLLHEKPDIMHCHNFHGRFFDLRALPWLSQQIPVIVTLHDMWMLTGHCSHTFGCKRWITGCGKCPDLTIYPSVLQDATDYNWSRKRRIYTNTRLYVATPCQWLMQKVEQSMLHTAVIEGKVIPNGVDLSVFHPQGRKHARKALGLANDTKIVLIVLKGKRGNKWQAYTTMHKAICRAAASLPKVKLQVVLLGKKHAKEKVGGVEFIFVPHQKSLESLALYYKASDVYIHPARADTFPSTILEALACGTPVIATAVGGIPEQVKGIQIMDDQLLDRQTKKFDVNNATGVLVSQGNDGQMAKALEELLKNDETRQILGENAARDARRRFDLKRQVDIYLHWFDEIAKNRQALQ